MRIDNSSSPVLKRSREIERGPDKENVSSESSPAKHDDRVQLSSLSQALLSPTDPQRLQALHDTVQSGAYQPPASQISDVLIQEMFE
ncbi:MAG: hypothetical protein WD696_22425 [Bryobacteraceae bacterium]